MEPDASACCESAVPAQGCARSGPPCMLQPLQGGASFLLELRPAAAPAAAPSAVAAASLRRCKRSWSRRRRRRYSSRPAGAAAVAAVLPAGWSSTAQHSSPSPVVPSMSRSTQLACTACVLTSRPQSIMHAVQDLRRACAAGERASSSPGDQLKSGGSGLPAHQQPERASSNGCANRLEQYGGLCGDLRPSVLQSHLSALQCHMLHEGPRV